VPAFSTKIFSVWQALDNFLEFHSNRCQFQDWIHVQVPIQRSFRRLFRKSALLFFSTIAMTTFLANRFSLNP
jgi:hypothetical protein